MQYLMICLGGVAVLGVALRWLWGPGGNPFEPDMKDATVSRETINAHLRQVGRRGYGIEE